MLNTDSIEFLEKDNKENILNIRLLNRSIKNKNLPHAFLFNGNNAEGLLKLALLFTCDIFCEKNGCLKCNACKNVLNMKHADLFLLKPAGASLSADEFRKEFEQKINKKAINNQHRVTIIRECESMSPGIADRFLKILEDPPGEELIFILLSEKGEAVRKTVSSRCQILNWHFSTDFSTEQDQKLKVIAAETENLLKRIIKAEAGIREILDFTSEIGNITESLLAETNERHKNELNLVKKSGMDEDYVSKMIKDIEESQKREKKKFANLIIAHVFDIISAYIDDIMAVISGFEGRFLSRKNNYEDIFNSFSNKNKNEEILRLDKIQHKIALNRKALTENINYETALDSILSELVIT